MVQVVVQAVSWFAKHEASKGNKVKVKDVLFRTW
jgi:hypothetical protein